MTATLDPETLVSSSAAISNTNHDMFCPGISMLGNGNIVVTGGNVAEKTSIYNVLTNAWEPGPNMNIARGYQSSVTLSTGEVRQALSLACFVGTCRGHAMSRHLQIFASSESVFV